MGHLGVRLRSAVNVLNGATAVGLLVARLGGAAARPGPDGLLVAHGYRLPVPVAAAFTVGNVVVHRHEAGWLEARPVLLGHEARHATQWALLGLPMLPLYLVAAASSWVRYGDWASGNPFEVRAGLAAGGYPLGAARRRRRLRLRARRRGR